MSAPVPAFAALWNPPAVGTVIRRPRNYSGAPVAIAPFDGVAPLICDGCGHRFCATPTRCLCIGSVPRVAPPLVPRDRPHWTENNDR